MEKGEKVGKGNKENGLWNQDCLEKMIQNMLARTSSGVHTHHSCSRVQCTALHYISTRLAWGFRWRLLQTQLPSGALPSQYIRTFELHSSNPFHFLFAHSTYFCRSQHFFLRIISFPLLFRGFLAKELLCEKKLQKIVWYTYYNDTNRIKGQIQIIFDLIIYL